MLFNSYTFIFLFLPVVWCTYYLACRANREAGLLVLCVASLFFYGYWDIRFLPLLLGSIAVNHMLSRLMHSSAPLSAKGWLAVGVIFNLGLLAFFKYMNFFSQVTDTFFGMPLVSFHVLLPIGISFFTFQQISFLVDRYRGKAPLYNLLDYTVFVSFFPQLIAGPIVHHSEMLPQFAGNKRPGALPVAIGMSIFIAGLFKKLVLADNIAPFATAVFAASDAGLPISFAETWGALIAFSFQMYFDFSGYCDMALGLALMFNIRLPINFFSPYKARSIREYWQRWHMTLGRFLRDYVYLPMGGSRVSQPHYLFNLMALMTISGFWHGAGWGFVLWGMLNGLWLWMNWLMIKVNTALGRAKSSIIPGWIACIMTFWAVSFGWTFFKSTNLDGAYSLALTALGFSGLSFPESYAAEFGGLSTWLEYAGIRFTGPGHVAIGDWAATAVPLILLSFLIVWAAPNTIEIFLSADRRFGFSPPAFLRWRPSYTAFASVAGLFFLSMLFASTISEFLYFQF